MTSEAFNEFFDPRPFEPFVIHVADGRIFEIPHPDCAALSPGRRTVSVLNTDPRIEIVDLWLVTSLRPLGRFGKAKR